MLGERFWMRWLWVASLGLIFFGLAMVGGSLPVTAKMQQRARGIQTDQAAIVDDAHDDEIGPRGLILLVGGD